MAHASITWSVTGEASNVTGNAVAKRLFEAGFVRRGKTAFRSAHDVPLPEVVAAITEALQILHAAPGGGTLDHVFVAIEGEMPATATPYDAPEDFAE
jgi:hypothetical protein